MPFAPEATTWRARTASGTMASPSSAQSVKADAHTSEAIATSRRKRVEPSGPRVTQHDREGLLAGDRVGRDVPQVVGDEDRAGQGADADRARDGEPGDLLDLHVRRAGTATRPKNTKTLTSPRAR